MDQILLTVEGPFNEQNLELTQFSLGVNGCPFPQRLLITDTQLAKRRQEYFSLLITMLSLAV